MSDAKLKEQMSKLRLLITGSFFIPASGEVLLLKVSEST
jgi:hypothetical protein